MALQREIPNTNDGSGRPPRLRCYLNLMALEDLPAFSSGPKGADRMTQLEAVATAGYGGVQFTEHPSDAERAACRRLGLGMTLAARVNEARDAAVLADRAAAAGMECVAVHLGWGLEDENEGATLITALIEASVRFRVPLYPETHRATLFQDLWRTVRFAKQFPGLRFNGDFSHWYTGLEMVYGGFERKLEFIQPVLERVRFVHGRIGNPGCIQVDIGDADERAHPYVTHFRELWTRCFTHFLRRASGGDSILFVPELLAPRIYYARTFRDAGGVEREESDRWQQSLVLRRIAEECFEAARTAAHRATPGPTRPSNSSRHRGVAPSD